VIILRVQVLILPLVLALTTVVQVLTIQETVQACTECRVMVLLLVVVMALRYYVRQKHDVVGQLL